MSRVKMNCLWCKLETTNQKYCRLSCQMSHRNILQKEKRILEYMNNPNKCFMCGVALPYIKQTHKFCSKSCSASYHNFISQFHITIRKPIVLCLLMLELLHLH